MSAEDSSDNTGNRDAGHSFQSTFAMGDVADPDTPVVKVSTVCTPADAAPAARRC